MPASAKTVVESPARPVPERRTLASLREAAHHCQACPLWRRGTQTVFGEGNAHASVMLVGEQPGDQEDLSGRPFVGPAGRVLDDALDAAGIARGDAYVTNAVKHFKWIPKGKRRLHQKPNAREIGACIPWLEDEIDLVRPKVLICLGATAAQGLFGRDFRVSKQRGVLIPFAPVPYAFATVHPSSILRGPPEEREQSMQAFIADLKLATQVLRKK